MEHSAVGSRENDELKITVGSEQPGEEHALHHSRPVRDNSAGASKKARAGSVEPSNAIVDTGPTPPSIDLMATTEWRPKWSDVGTGLNDEECKARKEQYGPNSLPEHRSRPILEYLKHYTGPMPCMIWLAIVILFLKCVLTSKNAWPDFIMCCILQLVNANMKWYNSRNAKNAINALKDQMAPASIAKRNGEWIQILAADLVPGDVIQVRIGDVVPADCICGPSSHIQVDQSALTGESLPKSIDQGETLLASSAVKRGEGEAVVTHTGVFTVIGRAASMVGNVKKTSRYDRILFYVAIYLLTMAALCMTILFVFMVYFKGEGVLSALSVVVAILIGALPVAMHVVCMVIMAMGAFRLSQENAVVTELTATEELSGMSILCTDKTGTLTLNRLEIMEEECVAFECTNSELLFYAALACKRSLEGQDAIDHCITQTCQADPELWARVETYTTTQFTPFDPTIKRTEAIVEGPNGEVLQAAKGAPQVMLNSAENKGTCGDEALDVIEKLARRGYRTLGVSKGSLDGTWTLMGLLAISDPPRHDTTRVIAKAQGLGIKVIMITGDQTAIAREVGRQTGIGTNILSSHFLTDYDSGKLDPKLHERLPDIIEYCDGFAEVLPEHKFRIVEILQKKGYIVGMTGDGVNDAPALKKANVGIAVSGATDAARAAASIFLKEDGLGVIITAIMRSKKVFERVKNYIIYRSATSLRLMGFFFICAIFISPLDYLPGYEDGVDNNYRDFCTGTMAKPLDHSITEDGVDQYSQHATCVRTPHDLLPCMKKHEFNHAQVPACVDEIWAADGTDGSGLRKTSTFFVGATVNNTFVVKEGCWNDDASAVTSARTNTSSPFYGGIGSRDWEDQCLTSEGRSTLQRSILSTWQRIAEEAQETGTTEVSKDAVANTDRLVRSDMYISSYFEPPTLVIIVLTLLNDFTVITIAFDHVQISQAPDHWWLWRNIALGTVIGANTLLWSVVMFLVMLHALDPRSFVCQRFGVCLEYPEILTGAFLQLSLCARMARTNARMDHWFCSLSLRRSVVMTMTFSIVAAMLISFTWPFCPTESSCSPRMVPLNPIMCGIIILYQIPVHLFRDLCKMGLYAIFRRRDLVRHAREVVERKKIREECGALMKEHGLCINFDKSDVPTMTSSHDLQKIRKISRGDSLTYGILDTADAGPCLPEMPFCFGPRLVVWKKGGNKCGCNPLMYFVLFAVVGIAAVTIRS
eukprot:GEMP01002217.1.p1 GENE.GEMP01002217.1~~GEMP01002217.1.p1  ORF type:complete len:1221 (+),score=269.49 GEMP01002217.1:27-3665(+)